MKVPHTRNGIIYCRTGSHKSSAVVLANELTITSGLALLQVLHTADSLDNLPQNILIAVDKHTLLRELEFRVILANETGRLIETGVRIAYVFVSKSIELSIKQNFKDLKFLINGEYHNVTDYARYFATVVLFQPENQVMPIAKVQWYFKNFLPGTRSHLSQLEEVACVSAPFGNENFINSIHFGHVANTFGDDHALALLNVTTAFGSEGGGVYDNKLQLRGLLLGSAFSYQKDNACFTLAMNLKDVFKVFFNTYPMNNNTAVDQVSALTKSVCMIDSMGCWGTGCLFRMQSQQFVLTCAHVISSDNIICYTKDRERQLELLYKNPFFDTAFDIALLKISSKSSTSKTEDFCQLASYTPTVGQVVYSVGFPLFKALGLSDRFKPSIYRGRITKYSRGILFTDCSVQAGQSGGPVFDAQGNLVAVMVSNFKCSMDDKIYPQHNMCIPVCEISSVMEEYCKRNDPTILRQFQASADIIDKWKLRSVAIDSKL